jgi:hypothetical protein
MGWGRDEMRFHVGWSWRSLGVAFSGGYSLRFRGAVTK